MPKHIIMKKILLMLCAIAALSSCGVLQTREMQKQVIYIDYRPYVDAGFYLSPNEYPGPHTPVGELKLIIDPAVVELDRSGFDDNLYYSVKPAIEVPLNAKEVLEMAVKEAARRGSNGISNLKIEVVTQDYMYYKQNGLLGTTGLTMPVNRYIVSGVLIRVMNND